MFSFLKAKPVSLKGYKIVLNSDRQKKYGIASNSLHQMKEKIEEKFKIQNFNLFLNDGCLIEDEDYFLSLPAQSVIVVALEGDIVKSDLDVVIENFRKINSEILEAKHLFEDYMQNNDHGDIFEALNVLQDEIEEKIKLTTREDHPEWFENLLGNSKEEVMKRKAADRIKGYFYKTKDELTKSSMYRTNFKARKIIDDLLSDFYLFLNGVEYFSCLFDRSCPFKFSLATDEIDAQAIKAKRRRIDPETKAKIAETEMFKSVQKALCDDKGFFKCHGVWNASKCNYSHKINPYASKESVILFSIYNLDHQIEISRSIFPSILKNVEEILTEKNVCDQHKSPGLSLSVLTYFYEIFTIKNLKLVQIVCHDKGSHDLKSKGRVLCKKCPEYKKLEKIKLKIS